MIVRLSAEIIHREISPMLQNGASYIDALTIYAHDNNMEIEALASIISKSEVIVEKIRSEAVSMRLVKDERINATICD